ncbi:MAG: phosphoglucosamine mutase [Candidatus Omnitrophota bacterium]|nr:MAG: phosphoglucosamine mutase [Candidatus Omnitrophota bacterium]
MEIKSLKISVAGIRGIYPSQINPEIAFKFGVAFGNFLKEKNIFVGRDTRISGDVLKSSLISGILASGKNVIDLGIVPTPTVEFIVEKNENCGGAIITASHNPSSYNGIKLLSPEGTFLNEREKNRFISFFSKNQKIKKRPGSLTEKTDSFLLHADAIFKNVNVELIKKFNFKVVVDPCQGVGALYSEKFLKEMGCQVTVINRSPLGKFSHNPEPLPQNLKELAEKVKETKSDIGFAQDPDGDRLAIVSENGEPLSEEYSLLIALDHILSKEKGSVVVNLSTNSAVEKVCEKYGVEVFRTKIGEVNVVEKMKKTGSVIGGEGNGGIIWPKVHYGRDSFVAMALILESMAERKKKISEIVKEFPPFFLLKKKIAFTGTETSLFKKLEKFYRGNKLIKIDGIKILKKEGWIHVRISGTEPVLRIFIEGKDKKTAENLYREVLGVIRQD